MIRINLLPPEVRTTELKVNPKHVAAGVAVLLGTVILPHWLVQTSRRNRLREEVASIQNELERYKPIVAQVEALEKAKSELEQRKSIIQKLETERLRYPFFMEDFLKLLPGNVWITGLSTTLPQDGASLSVSLDVVALDHYAVADIVSNLETSQIFSDVNVGAIALSQSASGQSISFHIGTTYRKAALDATVPKKS